MTRVNRTSIAVALLAIGSLVGVGVAVAEDKTKVSTCQAQLAERTWNYEQLAKDRQAKEQQRDHADVQVYVLQRTVQQLERQLAELKETLEKTEKPAAEPETKEK